MLLQQFGPMNQFPRDRYKIEIVCTIECSSLVAFIYFFTILSLMVDSSSVVLVAWFGFTSNCMDIDSASFSNSVSRLRSTPLLPGPRLRDRMIGFVAIVVGCTVFKGVLVSVVVATMRRFCSSNCRRRWRSCCWRIIVAEVIGGNASLPVDFIVPGEKGLLYVEK